MNGFTSYLITYSILGSLLGYYIIIIGKRLDNLQVRIKEAKWALKETNSENK